MSSKRAMKQAQKQAYAKHRSNITNSRFGMKKKNFTKNQAQATYHVHQMAISLDWLIENYTDRDHTIVANDRMWKSKNQLIL